MFLKLFLYCIFGLLFFSCSSSTSKVVSHNTQALFHSDCEVKILSNGREALLQRIKLIRNARKTVELQTFIWTDDECGRILFNELLNAAKRGVKVRIICDHLFSTQDASALAAISKTKNLSIKIYNPAGESIKADALTLMLETIGDFKKVNQRMHNKLLLIDDRIGICGGRNIEDTYYDNAPGLNFKDLDLVMKGSVTKSMKKSFETFWNSPICVSLSSFKDVAEKMNENIKLNLQLQNNKLYQKLPEQLASFNSEEGYFTVDKLAFFSDKPGKNNADGLGGSSILNEFIVKTLKEAKQRVWIQSPYLVLSSKAQQDFLEIRQANKNLDIKISTNSLAATDSWPTYAFLYKQKKVLINDLGVEVYEYNPMPGDLLRVLPNYSELLRVKAGLDSLTENQWHKGEVSEFTRLCLHSKCMLVDDTISFVGSYNMDPRSANLNTELSAVIIDKNFNQRLAQHIKTDIAARNSWVVAKRKTIIGLKQINSLISAISDLGGKVTGLDLWPRRYTSCFQLKKGAEEVGPGHKDFYENYYSVGNFPRVPLLGEKEILARFFKAFGIALKPIL